MSLLVLASFLSGMSSWALAGLGIGLVIFVHELGHFLVAKKFGVRCEIFSLGFGPRLLGFKRGDTDYRLSLVPIGGYVKMAGDNPGEDLEGDEGELPSKTVMQRLWIFSAGVIMNLIFALVTLPLVFAAGVQFHSTTLGPVTPGEPAWKAGLREGDEIVSVAGHPVYDYSHIVTEVALGDTDLINIQYRRDGEVHTTRVIPVKDEQLGRYKIGVQPSSEEGFKVIPGGPAATAGMSSGDRIVSVNGKPIGDLAEFDQLRVENLQTQVTLEIATRASNYQQRRTITVQPDPTEEPIRRVGIILLRNEIAGLRGEAEQLGLDLKSGDQLVRLRFFEGNSPVKEEGTYVSVHNRDQLAEALEIAAEATLEAAFEVRRNSRTVFVKLPDAVDKTLADDIALVPNSGSWVRVREGYPAELSSLPEVCQIIKVNGKETSDWSEISETIRNSFGSVRLTYRAGDQTGTVEIQPQEEIHYSDFGLALELKMVERSYGIVEATKVGVTEAGYMLKNIYLTLKKIFSREVSPKNLSGIVTIARVSQSLAESGLSSLFFFLAILSLNLAFLNILPIPVLDGGHILFLLVEKVKGSPVSERVMGYSQLVGLVMVLALLLYVTYNDLARLFQF